MIHMSAHMPSHTHMYSNTCTLSLSPGLTHTHTDCMKIEIQTALTFFNSLFLASFPVMTHTHTQDWSSSIQLEWGWGMGELRSQCAQPCQQQFHGPQRTRSKDNNNFDSMGTAVSTSNSTIVVAALGVRVGSSAVTVTTHPWSSVSTIIDWSGKLAHTTTCTTKSDLSNACHAVESTEQLVHTNTISSKLQPLSLSDHQHCQCHGEWDHNQQLVQH